MSAFLFSYYSVHGGKSLLWAGQDMLGLFILIELLRIDALTAGSLFMLSSVLNAAMDMAAGYLLGRSDRSAAQRTRLISRTILLASLAFGCLPWIPAGGALLAGAVLILARLGHSVLDVAHNALSSDIVQAEGDFRLAQRRSLLSSATSILIGLAAIPLRSLSDGPVVPALSISLIALLAFIGLAPLSGLMSRTVTSRLAITQPRRMPRAILLLCLATLIGMIGLGALAKCLLHLRFPSPWIGPAAIFIYIVARLAAVWVWQPLAVRRGNREALCAVFAFAALGALALPTLVISPAGAVVAILLLGLAGGGGAMLCWAALTELIQASGETAGLSQAWIYGAFTMFAKIGLGLSGLAVGAWLEVVPLSGGSLTVSSNLWGIASLSAICCLASAVLLNGPHPRFLRTH